MLKKVTYYRSPPLAILLLFPSAYFHINVVPFRLGRLGLFWYYVLAAAIIMTLSLFTYRISLNNGLPYLVAWVMEGNLIDKRLALNEHLGLKSKLIPSTC